MPVIEYDFYDPADPTTLLGTLDDTQLKSMEFRPALYELGAGSLKVSRHLAAASTDLLRKGNMVFVRVPEISEDPIWGWVIKDGDAALVSKKEQGGENLSYTGPGLLYMLSWARLREDWFAPGQPQRGSAQIDGQWTWHNEPYGAILTRIMEEGQNQPGTPLAHISVDFDREEDSLGNAWSIIPEEFIVRIGEDNLSIAQKLATGGELYLELGPDLVLHAYQSVPGRDLTGTFGAGNVRFEKGVNIATELTRKTRRSAVTHLVTRDRDGVFDHHVIPGFSGQAKYGFTEIDFTNSPGEIDKIAQQTLVSSATEAEEFALEVTPGDDEAAGLYLPGPSASNGHYWVGDQVTVHTGSGEHDLNATAQRVIGIRITLDEAADDSSSARAHRSLHTVPELAYRSQPVYAWGGGQGVLDPVTASPSCCGGGICSGQTVVGGTGILDFDWEDEPDHEETIPAIAALSQAAIDIVAQTDVAGVNAGEYRISLPRYGVATPTYVWFAATPGLSYSIAFDHYVFAKLGHSPFGTLLVEWVSGSFGAWTPISTDSMDFPRGGSTPVSAAGTFTAPMGAVGARLYQGQSGATYYGWHLHAIAISTGGAVIDCPPNSSAPHDHTHTELHTQHTVEELLTSETDDTLVLAPDGDGGVEWVTPPGGSGAPTTVDYLVGTASGDLSAEIVVGTTPGGELGGTWASPTVDATHSGSAHITDHGALSGLADDDHPQYVTEAEHAAIDHDAIVGNPDWPIQVVQAADQDVTNNATPQDSTDIVLTLDANSVYEFDYTWIWSCSSDLAKARWRMTCSQPIQWNGRAIQGTIDELTSAGANQNIGSAIGAASSGTQWPATDRITDLPGGVSALGNRWTSSGRFRLVTDGTGGTIKLQFANNAAGSGRVTRLHEGSILRARKLA